MRQALERQGVEPELSNLSAISGLFERVAAGDRERTKFCISARRASLLVQFDLHAIRRDDRARFARTDEADKAMRCLGARRLCADRSRERRHVLQT